MHTACPVFVTATSTRDSARPGSFFHVPWRWLGSRLGLRLLGLFALCTVVPTCAVAFLSWDSVTSQLTRQGSAQLEALAHSSGRQILDRLEFLAKDFTQQAPEITRCAKRNGEAASCFERLLYGAEEASVVDRMPDSLAPTRPMPRLVALADSGRSEPRFYLMVRAGSGSFVMLRINQDYLWGEGDEQNLPAGTHLTVSSGKTRLFGAELGKGLLSLASQMPESRVLETPALLATLRASRSPWCSNRSGSSLAGFR
jgi:hypothetical protein